MSEAFSTITIDELLEKTVLEEEDLLAVGVLGTDELKKTRLYTLLKWLEEKMGVSLGSDGDLSVAANNVIIKGREISFEPTDGKVLQTVSYSSSGNSTFGYGNYALGLGDSNIYAGDDIRFAISSISGNNIPYLKKGNSFNLHLHTSGYVTGGGTVVRFNIPISKMIIGNPTVTVSSVNGILVRQGGKYLYGDGTTTPVKPNSYQASLLSGANSGITCYATFANGTGVQNNSPVGIEASIKVTLS